MVFKKLFDFLLFFQDKEAAGAAEHESAASDAGRLSDPEQ